METSDEIKKYLKISIKPIFFTLKQAYKKIFWFEHLLEV